MINLYYNIFDRKIQNGSLLILIISLCIILTWVLFSPNKINILSANVINTQKHININWIEYKIIYEKLK